MSLREVGREKSEAVGDRHINFIDLNDSEAARKNGLPPGYYFTVVPVSAQEMREEMLLAKFTDRFFEMMQAAGLLTLEGAYIPFDTTQNKFAYPSQVWSFTVVGYAKKEQSLLVGANHIDSDEGQRMIINTLRQR